MRLTETPTYASIIKVIGSEDACKLSRMFGGRNLEIPVNARPSSQLSIAIGLDKARSMADVYGGMRWSVPITPGRYHTVISLRKAGKTLSQIAESEKISIRTVTSILTKEAESQQQDMFSTSPWH